VRVLVPEIADYEVRRELIRAGKTTGLASLDKVNAALEYVPLTTPTMLRAAELWAEARRRGIAAAGDKAIDADMILCAQALTCDAAGDSIVIATTNVVHLQTFVDAKLWNEIRQS
jgi:predicted nucleic acid-binding protein